MHNFPVFLTIDIGDEEDSFPVSIAWSLPDGQIKHTLISPDENWDIWSGSNRDIDIDLLFERGATAREIIEELSSDHDQSTLFCYDEDSDGRGLMRIFDSLDQEPEFELSDWNNAFDFIGDEPISETLIWITEQHGLDLHSAEDRVKAMLLSFVNYDNQSVI